MQFTIGGGFVFGLGFFLAGFIFSLATFIAMLVFFGGLLHV